MEAMVEMGIAARTIHAAVMVEEMVEVGIAVRGELTENVAHSERATVVSQLVHVVAAYTLANKDALHKDNVELVCCVVWP